MVLRRYNPKTDFEQIANWAKAREQSYDKDLFPPTGWIVEGVAAYFLYETPSKVCWLENMCSNPESIKEVRELALEQIISALLRDVKDKGYKIAYATTDIEAVINRAKKHKASASPDQTHLTLRFY
jgi:hypothetical protein